MDDQARPSRPMYSRRYVLAMGSGAAVAAVLAACGGDDASDGTTATTSGDTATTAGGAPVGVGFAVALTARLEGVEVIAVPPHRRFEHRREGRQLEVRRHRDPPPHGRSHAAQRDLERMHRLRHRFRHDSSAAIVRGVRAASFQRRAANTVEYCSMLSNN